MGNQRTVIPLLLGCLLLSVGCHPSAMERTPQATPDGVQKYDQVKTTPAERTPKGSEAPDRPVHPEKNRGKIQSPQIEQRSEQPIGLTEMANQIAQECTRIRGVSKAYVLLTGKTALIGVDLDSRITGSHIDTIKYSVKEAAERVGPGYHAVVTADLDTVTRIRNLAAGVRAGKPTSTFSDEMADILSRLLPET
jgi:YhcN/YlaJ family sporulation lipoprotein